METTRLPKFPNGNTFSTFLDFSRGFKSRAVSLKLLCGTGKTTWTFARKADSLSIVADRVFFSLDLSEPELMGGKSCLAMFQI